MAGYLAMRIMDGALDYVKVVTRFPQFKEDINKELKSKNREDLIPEEYNQTNN